MDPIYLLLSAVTLLVATALFFDRWERAQWSPTHKGWFGFLPVYIRDPEGECEIDGRFGLGFLVPVAAWIQNTAGAMRELFDPSLDPFVQPTFAIRITGRVTPLRPFWGSGKALILFALVMLPFLSAGCASMAPGSDPVVVKAEDVLTNSLTLYDGTMELHFKHSTSEPPEVYKALEVVRPAFPKAWRGLSTTLAAYKAAKTKDPATIRKATLDFLDETEKDGPPSWKTAVQGIRAVFNREAP